MQVSLLFLKGEKPLHMNRETFAHMLAGCVHMCMGSHEKDSEQLTKALDFVHFAESYLA